MQTIKRYGMLIVTVALLVGIVLYQVLTIQPSEDIKVPEESQKIILEREAEEPVPSDIELPSQEEMSDIRD